MLVGEVWIAAGQSNMEWTLAKEAHAKDQLPQANLPLFRLMNMGFAGQNASGKPFNADVAARHTPETFYKGEWQVSSPASAGPSSTIPTRAAPAAAAA